MSPDSNTTIRILLEETLGRKPARPDTAEEALHRDQIGKQVADLKRKGYFIEIPSEWPDSE